MTLIPPSQESLTAALKEYGTTMTRLKEDTQILKEWLQMQPHLPHTMDDISLQHMLVRCKNNVERAKQAIDMIYTLKTALPELFAGRDPLGKQLQFHIKNALIVPLPRTTSDGYRVTLLKTLIKDGSDINMEMFFKAVLMVADLRLREDACIGDILIHDCEFLGIGHISKVTFPFLKKIDLCGSKAYRARFKGVHIINAPPVIDVLMTTIKKVLRNKLAMRHHVHTSLESLYQHVERDILPVEYGGKERSVTELAAEWRQKLIDNRDWFIEQDQNGKAIEAKRPGKSFSASELFGFEGTFKQLSFD